MRQSFEISDKLEQPMWNVCITSTGTNNEDEADKCERFYHA